MFIQLIFDITGNSIFSYVPMIAAIIASAIFLTYIIIQTLNLADLSSMRGITIFSVIIAYPILDAIIIVPSFLIVANYRKEPHWFTPWVFKSAGIFLVAISDSWFALFVVTSMTNELWPSTMIFPAHNVIIAAGLPVSCSISTSFAQIQITRIRMKLLKKINHSNSMISTRGK